MKLVMKLFIMLPDAAIGGVEYLLTWNCRHIANADQLPLVYRTLRNLGLAPPLIVTPEEFSNDD